MIAVVCLSFILITACKLSVPSSTDFIEFDKEGIKAGEEYVMEVPETLRPLIEEQACDIYLLLRFTHNLKINRFPVSVEYSDPQKDSIFRHDIMITLFDSTYNDMSTGKPGILEKRFLIVKNYSPSEGFFFSFKTEQENTQGILSAALFFELIENQEEKKLYN